MLNDWIAWFLIVYAVRLLLTESILLADPRLHSGPFWRVILEGLVRMAIIAAMLTSGFRWFLR